MNDDGSNASDFVFGFRDEDVIVVVFSFQAGR